MISVGVKELKAKLSSYLDEVQKGKQIIITEHGREVAIVTGISIERSAIKALTEAGKAHWSGGKPKGIIGIKIKGNPLSDTVLEERR